MQCRSEVAVCAPVVSKKTQHPYVSCVPASSPRMLLRSVQPHHCCLCPQDAALSATHSCNLLLARGQLGRRLPALMLLLSSSSPLKCFVGLGLPEEGFCCVNRHGITSVCPPPPPTMQVSHPSFCRRACPMTLGLLVLVEDEDGLSCRKERKWWK